jgi:hypothetical protein
MGCGGSHHDVREKPENHITSKNNQVLDHDQEDAEILVISHGKGQEKSKLDEITENNLNLSKSDPKKHSSEKNHQMISSEVQSNSVYVKREEIQEEPEVISKAKTLKPGFESHPHEFDFSFIDEKAKDEDLLTDQILNEIKEMSK